jgi:hypothetical protein
MTARRFASQFWWLGGAHGYSMGEDRQGLPRGCIPLKRNNTRDEQTPKMAANPSAVARAGAQRRLMDYLGSWHAVQI